ncbi:MAG: Crp/Fnr family transcriptional regulator [Candidatus Competibacter sp.]|nr:Crp/Fnr family transcriptional regulator [Candidatus Competibacter sp.]MDG4584158.1 Crp/Fnr family transcriptional regulator [Candidatus Competibacter sp.]
MPPINKRTALAQHELFSHLEATEREQLLASGVERRFGDGQLIFQRGDSGDGMMLVLRGQVKISIVSDEGKELIFAMTQPGECFGEIALLDGRPRSADAIAVGDCVLFTLARSDFIPFLERHPQIAIRLLAVLCGRVRATSEFIERLAFQHLPVRLARLLLKLAEAHGVITPAGIRIDQKFSQEEIGCLVATSRESVNKQLRAWRADGLLTVERGYITLLRPALLKRLAQSS